MTNHKLVGDNDASSFSCFPARISMSFASMGFQIQLISYNLKFIALFKGNGYAFRGGNSGKTFVSRLRRGLLWKELICSLESRPLFRKNFGVQASKHKVTSLLSCQTMEKRLPSAPWPLKRKWCTLRGEATLLKLVCPLLKRGLF